MRSHGRGTFLGCAVVFMAALAAASAAASPQRFGHLVADLVAEPLSIAPGNPFTVALRLSMDPGWHTYWKNPGDSGLPTTITWDLPAGFEAGPIQWPAPSVLETLGLQTYGYEGQVALLVRITPPADIKPGQTVILRVHAGWLVCEKVCIPGKAELQIRLPVRTGKPSADPRWKDLFAEERSRIPRGDPSLSFSAAMDGKQVRLRVEGSLPVDVSGASFFPESSGLVPSNAPQSVIRDRSTLVLSMARSEPSGETPGRLAGVLVIRSGRATRAVAVDVPLRSEAIAAGAAPRIGLLLALVFAFLGGILLNLMPCVLPVLSLKVVSLVQQSHSSRRGAIAHGLLFSAGVLASFWLIVAVLLALRAGGQLLGWGFQFQNPAVVVIAASLFFLLGLSMFGVFEIGVGVTALVSSAPSRKGRAGSFFSGFLAKGVATPCTAPFMGSALGYAFSQPPVVVFAVFTSLALGLSLPFLVLSASPSLVTRIPRPGRWMETLKQVMGFPLMASAVWMGSVLVALSGPASLVSLLAAFVVSGAAAWVYGRWGGLDRARPTRIAARAVSAVLVVASLAVAIRGAPAAPSGARAENAQAASVIAWEPYSAARLAELRSQGIPVFIDFTARWCLTCQVNEQVALRGEAVRQKFQEKGVAALKADWTDRSDAIAQAVQEYGRAGVPLYVLFGKNSQQPTILPEILTQGIVLDALSKLP